MIISIRKMIHLHRVGWLVNVNIRKFDIDTEYVVFNSELICKLT